MAIPNARITTALAAGRSLTTGPWNVVRLKMLFAPMAIRPMALIVAASPIEKAMMSTSP